MVYGFVQQSFGYVEVDSAPQQGTTIRIFLPRSDAPVEKLPDAQASVAAPIGTGQTVLVVEDDPAVRQVAISTLRSLGFGVIEAQTADEAARMLESNEDVRLVLSDVRMPGELSGIDLARLIKRKLPDVHVLLTTGYVDSDETINDLELLYKPYRAADLAERIQMLLDGRQAAQQVPRRDAVPLMAAFS
jgi:CheY-like chemotaxis protein